MLLLFCGLVVFVYEVYRIETGPRLGFELRGGPWVELDDQIGYVPRPNSDTVFEHPDSNSRYHAFTDRLGARVSHMGDQTPEHVDVMILGCSFSWGLGVKNEDTYSEQLKQRLGVTTVNLAMGGYGSIQSLQRLQRNLDLRPKVVIYAFIQAHLARNVSPCGAGLPAFCVTQPYFEKRGASGDIHPPHPPLVGLEQAQEIMWHPGNLSHMLPAVTWALRSDLLAYTDPVDRSVESMNASVRFAVSEMAKSTAAIGATLVILYIPYLTPDLLSGPPQALLQAGAENNTWFIDLTSVVSTWLQQHPDEPLTLSPSDLHPNPLAHLLIAEQLASSLQEIAPGLVAARAFQSQ